jgi:hypothetical protein
MELIITNISCDIDLDGLYSVFFEYDSGYFCLARNIDESDEEIYIEKDEQNNSIYLCPNNIKYTVCNDKIEFSIDKDTELNGFDHYWILNIESIGIKQCNEIKKVLNEIWG